MMREQKVELAAGDARLFLDSAKAVAREAGRIAMSYFDSLRPNAISAKASPRDMVSAADVAVEKAIVARLRERFPAHGIYGEESGRANPEAEYCWIIDPIDGTQSFIQHHPYFSVSIALCRAGRPLVGVVYAPALGMMFSAENGRGAFLNDEPIRASSRTSLSEAACVTGFGCVRAQYREVNNLGYFTRIYPAVRDVKKCGSAALDLALTGAGVYDAYWEMALAEYDVAAGALIAREAGAVVSDLRGGSDFPAQGILAAAPGIYDNMLKFFHDLPEHLC